MQKFKIVRNLYYRCVAGYPVSVSGVITVPVSASVYQSMVASMQAQDGVCVAPLVQVPALRLHAVRPRAVRPRAGRPRVPRNATLVKIEPLEHSLTA